MTTILVNFSNYVRTAYELTTEVDDPKLESATQKTCIRTLLLGNRRDSKGAILANRTHTHLIDESSAIPLEHERRHEKADVSLEPRSHGHHAVAVKSRRLECIHSFPRT